MDLALMISETAASQYKNDCISNMCCVTIGMHNRYTHTISVIPLTNQIILKFKSMEYKIQRQNKSEYDEIVTFLIDEVSDAVELSLSDDIEFEGYWPNNDEHFNENYVKVTKNNEQIFFKPFNQDDLHSIISKYMRSLRLLN